METTTGRFARVGRWGANVAIAALLVLMLLQTCPGVPDWLFWRPRAYAELLGLQQNNWSMFTPAPDSENHRLRASIWYYDGHHVVWRSPDYDQQSWWERFVGHRRSEYIDEIHSPFYAPALPGLARWLGETNRKTAGVEGRLETIAIHVESTTIPDPRIKGWKRHRPEKFEHSSLLFSEDYP